MSWSTSNFSTHVHALRMTSNTAHLTLPGHLIGYDWHSAVWRIAEQSMCSEAYALASGTKAQQRNQRINQKLWKWLRVLHWRPSPPR